MQHDATHWVFQVPVKGYDGYERLNRRLRPSAQAALYKSGIAGIDYSSKCALKAREDVVPFLMTICFCFFV